MNFMKKNKIKLAVFICFILVIAVLGYRISISTGVLSSLFSNKIWVHRTNSIAKLEEVSDKFSGVELDIVFSSNYFDVNHPPSKSIHLSLNDYFKKSKNANLGYWLDFKNLNDSNAILASNLLDSITNLNRIKNENVIVESNDSKNLKLFSNKGFITSFYLPVGLHTQSKDSLETAIREIQNSIKDSPELCISSNFADYPIMRKHFPNQKKLLWYTGNRGKCNDVEFRMMLYRCLLDEKVKVLLLPVISKPGER